MARAYQCDKCRSFYLDEPYTMLIRDSIGTVVVEKDLCEACKGEIAQLFAPEHPLFRG